MILTVFLILLDVPYLSFINFVPLTFSLQAQLPMESLGSHSLPER